MPASKLHYTCRRGGRILLGLLAFAMWPLPRAAADAKPVIAEIAEIRRLSRDQAEKALPVNISGVCVWKGFQEFVIHDGETSIWIFSRMAVKERLLPPSFDPGNILIGNRYHIEGFTDPGDYAPTVVPTTIIDQGPHPLPQPRRVPVEAMLSGNEDGQFLEVEGVLQDVSLSRPPKGRPVLAMVVAGHHCRVPVAGGSTADFHPMVDARIRLRGIFAPDSNFRSEALNLKLLIHDVRDVVVLDPPPPDPFGPPRVPLNRLMPFSPDSRPYNRKVTAGVVVFAVPGSFFFLQDGERSIRVNSSDPGVKVGTRVAVAGFVDTTESLASLKNALVRPLGETHPPPPVAATVASLLDPATGSRRGRAGGNDFSGRRVTLRGVIRRISWRGELQPESLWAEADGHSFQILFPTAQTVDRKIARLWKTDAIADFTGICELEFRDRTMLRHVPNPIGFHLWMAGTGDVDFIHPAPWWTPLRLWIAFASAMALLILALAWNRSLHAMLRQRSLRIEEMMRAHRDSELEFRAARHERQRLAGDLHDGLQQLLVGASYRVEAAAADLEEVLDPVPPTIDEHLQTARSAVVRAQEGLRECLWGLRHVEEDPSDFAALLDHAARTVEHWPKDALDIEITGDPYPLSRHVMGTLLLLMQEAVANAFRHGAATHIQIRLEYAADRFEMAISDNGSGFDPAAAPGPALGHFGLDSMAHRMQWIGGSFEVKSAPHAGTRVLCQLPKARAIISADLQA